MKIEKTNDFENEVFGSKLGQTTAFGRSLVAEQPAAVGHMVAVVLRLALPPVKIAVTRDRAVVAIDNGHLRHVLGDAVQMLEKIADVAHAVAEGNVAGQTVRRGSLKFKFF